MYCIECGQELPASAKFCSNCGKAVVNSSAAVTGFVIDDVARKAQEIYVTDAESLLKHSPNNDLMALSVNNVGGYASNIHDNFQTDTLPRNANRVANSVENKVIHVGTYMSLIKCDDGRYCFYNPTNQQYSEFYDDARFPNYDGYACVKLNGYWGAIDKDFKVVVPLKYEYVWTFFEGYAVVQKGDRYGLVNTKGEEIVPIKYKHIHLNSNGLIFVWTGAPCCMFGVLDVCGKEIVPFQEYYDSSYAISNNGHRWIRRRIDHKYGFITEQGVMRPFIYDSIKWSDEENAWIGDLPYGDKEIICSTGCKPYKECKNNWRKMYSDIGDFSEGYAYVCQDGKYGYVNHSGNLVINPQYGVVGDFSNGGAMAMKAGLLSVSCGFIDIAGNYIVKWNRNKGFMPLRWLGHTGVIIDLTTDKFGLINVQGKVIVPMKYDTICDHNNVIYAEYQGKWGIIDEYGNHISPMKYDDITFYDKSHFVVVEYEGKEYIIDRVGNIISAGYDYIDCNTFDNERLSVKQNSKYGVLNATTCKLIIPCIYDEINRQGKKWKTIGQSKYIDAELNGRRVIINQDGIELEYVDGYNWYHK